MDQAEREAGFRAARVARSARRRDVGWLLVLVLLGPACADEPEATLEGGRTNVVLLIVDTLRADHLGAWGHAADTSPRIDALAAGGVRFARFYANAPWTRPSLATLLTGRYPRSTGVLEEQFDALADDLTTLAERLDARGYLTLGVTANPTINAWFGFGQGFDAYADSEKLWRWMPGGDGERGSAGPDGARTTTDRALALLDEYASADGPFFLQVLYIDPHRPYEAPPAYAQGLEGPHREYDAEIRYVDAELGRLLDALEARGDLEDTLVVVTSDHGEGLDSHGELPKADRHGYYLYDSVLHVPLVLWHPALAARVIEAPASMVDLVPTLLDLLGWPPEDPGLQGRSRAAWVRGRTPTDAAPLVFAETEWRAASKVSVRSPTHRYVRSDDARRFQSEGRHEGRELGERVRAILELPAEELHQPSPEWPEHAERGLRDHEVRATLAEALRHWEQTTPARPPLRRSPEDVDTLGDGTVVPTVPGGSGEAPSPEVLEQLRALGYLGDD